MGSIVQPLATIAATAATGPAGGLGAGLLSGGFGSALPLISTALSIGSSLMNKPDMPSAPDAVAPPPAPVGVNPEATTNSANIVDAQTAQQRSLKRRIAAQSAGLSLLSSQSSNTTTTTGA